MSWTDEKPNIFKEDCVLLTATEGKPGNWELDSFFMCYMLGVNDKEEDAWYWAICDIDGEEWGDYADLSASFYQIVDLPDFNKIKSKR